MAIASLWLLAVFVAPLLAQRQSSLAPLVYAFFDAVCHQDPARSFHLDGGPLAVCHRCTGLYLGFFLGLATLPRWPRGRSWLLERPRRVIVFALPMLIDVAVLANTPASRFSTGLIAAAPVAVLLWAAAEQLLHLSTPQTMEGEP